VEAIAALRVELRVQSSQGYTGDIEGEKEELDDKDEVGVTEGEKLLEGVCDEDTLIVGVCDADTLLEAVRVVDLEAVAVGLREVERDIE
jgi:hypothetical protein